MKVFLEKEPTALTSCLKQINRFIVFLLIISLSFEYSVSGSGPSSSLSHITPQPAVNAYTYAQLLRMFGESSKSELRTENEQPISIQNSLQREKIQREIEQNVYILKTDTDSKILREAILQLVKLGYSKEEVNLILANRHNKFDFYKRDYYENQRKVLNDVSFMDESDFGPVGPKTAIFIASMGLLSSFVSINAPIFPFAVDLILIMIVFAATAGGFWKVFRWYYSDHLIYSWVLSLRWNEMIERLQQFSEHAYYGNTNLSMDAVDTALEDLYLGLRELWETYMKQGFGWMFVPLISIWGAHFSLGGMSVLLHANPWWYFISVFTLIAGIAPIIETYRNHHKKYSELSLQESLPQNFRSELRVQKSKEVSVKVDWETINAILKYGSTEMKKAVQKLLLGAASYWFAEKVFGKHRPSSRQSLRENAIRFITTTESVNQVNASLKLDFIQILTGSRQYALFHKRLDRKFLEELIDMAFSGKSDRLGVYRAEKSEFQELIENIAPAERSELRAKEPVRTSQFGIVNRYWTVLNSEWELYRKDDEIILVPDVFVPKRGFLVTPEVLTPEMKYEFKLPKEIGSSINIFVHGQWIGRIFRRQPTEDNPRDVWMVFNEDSKPNFSAHVQSPPLFVLTKIPKTQMVAEPIFVGGIDDIDEAENSTLPQIEPEPQEEVQSEPELMSFSYAEFKELLKRIKQQPTPALFDQIHHPALLKLQWYQSRFFEIWRISPDSAIRFLNNPEEDERAEIAVRSVGLHALSGALYELGLTLSLNLQLLVSQLEKREDALSQEKIEELRRKQEELTKWFKKFQELSWLELIKDRSSYEKAEDLFISGKELLSGFHSFFLGVKRNLNGIIVNQYFESALEEIREALQIIDAQLQFLTEKGFSNKHFSLKALNINLTKELENRIGSQNYDLKFSETDVSLTGNLKLIVRMLLELAFNATGFRNRSASTPKIQINVTQDQNQIVMTVRDYGRGISEELLQKAGDRARLFYLGESSRHAKSHSSRGLGLAEAWHITKLFGGTIEAKNRPESGAEFVIRLPIKRSELREKNPQTNLVSMQRLKGRDGIEPALVRSVENALKQVRRALLSPEGKKLSVRSELMNIPISPDGTLANEFKRTHVLTLLPNAASDPNIALAFALKFGNQIPVVILARTPEESVLISSQIPETHRVIVVTRANAPSALQVLQGRIQMDAYGLSASDRDYANQLEKILQIPIKPHIFDQREDLESALGIARFAQNLRLKLRQLWLQAQAA